MLLWLSLVACTGPDVVETTEDGLRRLSVTLESDRKGVATLAFDVEPGETSLLATAQLMAPMTTHILSLRDPDNVAQWKAEEWLGGSLSKSNAQYLGNTVSLNWPVDFTDVALSEGTWRLDLGVVDDQLLYSEGMVDLDVLIKPDADLEGGEVKVVIFYTEALDDDPEVQEELRGAMDEAILQWEELYAQAGLTVSVRTEDWTGPSPVGTPAEDAESVYRDMAASVSRREVAVVVVPVVEGIDALGISGDIPGPLVATNKSAVIVSHIFTAGIDLRYNTGETRILAETLAHETGHFLGLYHPVETSWEIFDALEDTPDCGGARTCESELGTNLMFPYPLCSPPPCKAQPDLTAGQGSVLNRYTGVD
jgi:hypothetical protein